MQGEAGDETVRLDGEDDRGMALKRESVQRSPADNRNAVVASACARRTSARSAKSGCSEMKHD